MSATDGSNSLDDLDHAALLELRKELRRPLYTLVVTQQDPFTAGQPARREAAEWFAKLWKRFGFIGPTAARLSPI